MACSDCLLRPLPQLQLAKTMNSSTMQHVRPASMRSARYCFFLAIGACASWLASRHHACRSLGPPPPVPHCPVLTKRVNCLCLRGRLIFGRLAVCSTTWCGKNTPFRTGCGRKWTDPQKSAASPFLRDPAPRCYQMYTLGLRSLLVCLLLPFAALIFIQGWVTHSLPASQLTDLVTD